MPKNLLAVLLASNSKLGTFLITAIYFIDFFLPLVTKDIQNHILLLVGKLHMPSTHSEIRSVAFLSKCFTLLVLCAHC
jgi:hypothetical protein